MDMKETFILRTTSLHTSPDVVHIESIGYDQSESMYIEYDARALLEDIPSLYAMAKQAIKQGEEYNNRKYRDMLKDIKQDIKRPVGRPKKK
jgi:Iap family predicted aminopeptidase